MEKTSEEKRLSVLAYCEQVCPNPNQITVLYDRFACLQHAYRWNLHTYWKLAIGVNTVGHTIEIDADVDGNHWDFLYSALGLAERDAVEAERKISDEYLDRLKAELERSAKRVKALENSNAAIIDVDKHGEPFDKLRVAHRINSEAIAAHKKGGTNVGE